MQTIVRECPGPVPASTHVAALDRCTFQGLTTGRVSVSGHGITAPPARDLPGPWLSMLAHSPPQEHQGGTGRLQACTDIETFVHARAFTGALHMIPAWLLAGPASALLEDWASRFVPRPGEVDPVGKNTVLASIPIAP